jgi:hypothetical protein
MIKRSINCKAYSSKSVGLAEKTLRNNDLEARKSHSTRTGRILAVLPTVLSDWYHRTFGYGARRQGCVWRIAVLVVSYRQHNQGPTTTSPSPQPKGVNHYHHITMAHGARARSHGAYGPGTAAHRHTSIRQRGKTAILSWTLLNRPRTPETNPAF